MLLLLLQDPPWASLPKERMRTSFLPPSFFFLPPLAPSKLLGLPRMVSRKEKHLQLARSNQTWAQGTTCKWFPWTELLEHKVRVVMFEWEIHLIPKQRIKDKPKETRALYEGLSGLFIPIKMYQVFQTTHELFVKRGMSNLRANAGRVKEQIHRLEGGQGTCINSPIALGLIRRLYQKEEFCSGSGTNYITWYRQCMFHTWPGCDAAVQGQPRWVPSAFTVNHTAFSRRYGGHFCLPRHAGRSCCRSQCPVQPRVGKTCPAGNCSLSAGEIILSESYSLPADRKLQKNLIVKC